MVAFVKIRAQAGTRSGVLGGPRGYCEGYADIHAPVCGPTLIARGGLDADTCGMGRQFECHMTLQGDRNIRPCYVFLVQSSSV